MSGFLIAPALVVMTVTYVPDAPAGLQSKFEPAPKETYSHSVVPPQVCDYYRRSAHKHFSAPGFTVYVTCSKEGYRNGD